MTLRTATLTALLIAAAFATTGAHAAKLVDPDELVRDAADRTFAAIDANRAEYSTHPDELRKVAEDILLPDFDTDYATRLVLGRYWTVATPEQRSRFQKAFIDFLMRTYARNMLEFKRDSVHIIPLNAATDPRRTVVRSQITRQEGQVVPVDYTLHMTPDGWKVFDLTIEGISYVLNYRNSFADEIARSGGGDVSKGIDAVIKRLEGGAVAAPGGQG